MSCQKGCWRIHSNIYIYMVGYIHATRGVVGRKQVPMLLTD